MREWKLLDREATTDEWLLCPEYPMCSHNQDANVCLPVLEKVRAVIESAFEFERMYVPERIDQESMSELLMCVRDLKKGVER